MRIPDEKGKLVKINLKEWKDLGYWYTMAGLGSYPNPLLTEDNRGRKLGVCTEAGFGDGIYDFYVGRTKGTVTQIRIVFITQEELDELT